jgi:PAS domain S-box-containing protein
LSLERHQESFFRVHKAMVTCASEAKYAVDEKGLFQSACSVLVRSGLFQFAWFGYVAENTARIGEPVAWAGSRDEFLEELKVALRQEQVDDPAIDAIRTGQPCWIKTISMHPALEPIRSTALRHGYTSVISVPVISTGKVHGVLSLYYGDPEEYGQEILSFLKEGLSHVRAVFAGRPPTPSPRSEEFEAELLNLLDVLPLTVGLTDATGNLLHINRRTIEYHGYSLDEHLYENAVGKYTHPDDFERLHTEIANKLGAGLPFEYEARHLRREKNEYRWTLVLVAPIRDDAGQIIRWCYAGTDIEERKRAEQKIRQSEADLLEAQRISHTGSWKRDLPTEIMTITPEMARMFGAPEGENSITTEVFFSRLHQEDRRRQAISYQQARESKADFVSDYRIVLPDGSVRHVHDIGHPKLNDAGDLVEFIGTVIDVTAAKEAEEKIRQSEREARQLLDLSPMHITLYGPDGTRLYNNQAALDYYGLALEDWRTADSENLVHSQDAELVMRDVPSKFLSGFPFEIEVRLKRMDGRYRWFHYRFSPMLDEQARITRWHAAGTDIDDRKAAEQRLREENVSLREEIDKASMFEEIVGASAPLKTVLSRISKVAPTDSGVLITGETGTGKELVARAIHRRSRRSARPFVSVNCAVIPRELIASELFGHEKGAFTGATQLRLGRFELAAGGTIFLDEAGELPAETQIALLRVLQEHEFERVGGTGVIRTDVRVIAATNRDLEAAIAAGTFRSDLYYRLNVFPIEMPPLRERKGDIPLLVEYFLDRYSRKAGKSFKRVDKSSLDLLRSYPWPGNIRELQNVVERSVIVSENETFSVDESWLARTPTPKPKDQVELPLKLANQERETIEAALRDCGGRVAGPSGAAAKLGIPGSTLESKIRSLKIDKHRFKRPDFL